MGVEGPFMYQVWVSYWTLRHLTNSCPSLSWCRLSWCRLNCITILVPVSADDLDERPQGRLLTSLLFRPTPEKMHWWTAGQASGLGLRGRTNGQLVHDDGDDDDNVYVPTQSSAGWASGCSCPTAAASAVVLCLHCNQPAWVSVCVLNQSLLHSLVMRFPHIGIRCF